MRQHTPTPKVLTGLVTGASRSLHRPDFNTSQHNHEARLGISPSEQSFSEMGIKHVAELSTVSAGRREKVSQRVTEPSHSVKVSQSPSLTALGQTWWGPLHVYPAQHMWVLEKLSTIIDIQWGRV